MGRNDRIAASERVAFDEVRECPFSVRLAHGRCNGDLGGLHQALHRVFAAFLLRLALAPSGESIDKLRRAVLTEQRELSLEICHHAHHLALALFVVEFLLADFPIVILVAGAIDLA